MPTIPRIHILLSDSVRATPDRYRNRDDHYGSVVRRDFP
jgi:hypothetical protein